MKNLSCELHCHTLHSDGNVTPIELVSYLKACGNDLIALTDHNTLSGYKEFTKNIQKKYIPVIRGIEWTTFYGHAIVLGCDTFVDWRKATKDNIDEYLDKIHDANGLFGIAHPFDMGNPICTGGYFEYNIKDYSKIDYIEVWHGASVFTDNSSKRAKEFWISLLDSGFHIPLSYGRDFHRYSKHEIPFPSTRLLVKNFGNKAENALKAIKLGKTSVSYWKTLNFTVTSDKKYYLGETAKKGKMKVSLSVSDSSFKKTYSKFGFIPKKYRIVGENNETIFECSFKNHISSYIEYNGKYLRAELVGAIKNTFNELDKATTEYHCDLALTSPIYLK